MLKNMKKKINNFFLRCFHLADYRLSTLAAVKLDDQSRFFFLPFIRCQGQLESFLAELGARGQTTFQIIIKGEGLRPRFPGPKSSRLRKKSGRLRNSNNSGSVFSVQFN